MKIRFGLGAIKNVGKAAVGAILEARKEGPFRNFTNFCLRVDGRKVNRRAIESLIKAGAFDQFGERSKLLALLGRVLERSAKKSLNQVTLFKNTSEELPPLPNWSTSELLRAEKEVLGFYLSGHPLKDYEELLTRHSKKQIRSLEDLEGGEEVSLVGLISEVREIRTRKGDRMAVIELEDLTGRIEGVVFPDLFREVSNLLFQEIPLKVEGILEKDEEGRPRIRVQSIKAINEDLSEQEPKRIRLKIKLKALSVKDLEALKSTFLRHQGPCEVLLHLIDGEREVVVRLPDPLRVKASENLRADLERLLGPHSFWMEVE